MTDPTSDGADGALPGLLSAADVRRLAQEFDMWPTKRWGQNFVIDANTVRQASITKELLEVVGGAEALG